MGHTTTLSCFVALVAVDVGSPVAAPAHVPTTASPASTGAVERHDAFPMRSALDESSATIHVAMTADRRHWQGMRAALKSMAVNARDPSAIHAHLIVTVNETGLLRNSLVCSGAEDWHLGRLQVITLPVEYHLHARVGKATIRRTGNLEAPHNYARFSLHMLLPPNVEKVIYLDSDIVVLGDVAELWALAPRPDGNWVCAAVPRSMSTAAGLHSLERARKYFERRYNKSLELSRHEGYNAGVMVWNLRSWRERGLSEEARYWVMLNNKKRLWTLGSQPPLMLTVLGTEAPDQSHNSGQALVSGCLRIPATTWHRDCLGCSTRSYCAPFRAMRSSAARPSPL